MPYVLSLGLIFAHLRADTLRDMSATAREKHLETLDLEV